MGMSLLRRASLPVGPIRPMLAAHALLRGAMVAPGLKSVRMTHDVLKNVQTDSMSPEAGVRFCRAGRPFLLRNSTPTG